MKRIPKWLLLVTMLFVMANVFIFINRNNMFEYVKYSNIPGLYPEEPDASFLIKWNRCNQSFNMTDLDQGISLLREHTGIDTVSDEKEKMLKIASWLYRSFYQQQGIPDVHLSTLNPLQQYNYLKSNREKKLWCGYFQRMFGFFVLQRGFKTGMWKLFR